MKPAAEPMMIFGGSQTSVATPQIFDKIASANKKGIGLTFNILAMIIVTGAIRTMVVTLSSIIERTAVRSPSHIKRYQIFHLLNFAVLIAIY